MGQKTSDVYVVRPVTSGLYVLKGQIKDFHFTIDVWPIVNPDGFKGIEIINLPDYFSANENIDNIEPGGMVYDIKGTLIAKVGSTVNDGKVNVEEIYCWPHSCNINEKNSESLSPQNTLK